MGNRTTYTIITALVNDEVQALMYCGEMFSAHDVKLIIRHNNPHATILHNDVRDAVRDMYADGGMEDYYICEDFRLRNGELTRVYHDDLDVVEDYDQDAIATRLAPKKVTVRVVVPKQPRKIAPKKAVKKSTPLWTKVTKKATTTDTALTVDGRGRLCLPAKMVRGMGLKHGDDVSVFVGATSITVNKLGGTPDYTYVVDKADNIRLSASVVSNIGIATFKVKQNGNSIVITA